MKSSITFLGTSTDPLVVAKGVRSSAGFVFRYEDTQFHVDPGSGALSQAHSNGVSVRAHTGVIATRNSLHRAGSANYLLDSMTYTGLDKKGVLLAEENVLGAQGFIHPSAHEHVERVISLSPGKKVGVNDVDIHTLETNTKGTIGLKFLTPAFSLVYSGDTKYSVTIANQYKDASILVLNVPHRKKHKDQIGMTIEDAISTINHAKPRLAIITNFDKEFIEQDPVFQVRQIQQETGVQTIAAHDGLVIYPSSYSAEGGQQQLPKDRQGVSITESHSHLLKKDEEKTEQQTLEVEDVVEDPSNIPSVKESRLE